MSETIINIEQLSFSYGEQNVLTQLNMAIKKGKITTLIGANGCGKSTLLNIITKNLKPYSGSIFINGQEISDIKLKDFARNVAIVHQYNTAPSDITVETLVSYGRIPYKKLGEFYNKEDEEKIKWALEVTNTYKYKDRALSELSGGQKQRVWIAMALAQDTKLLLLDEPTTYLDIGYQLQILKLVKMLNQEYGFTVVMVLHDINQSLYYSDEIVALKNGKVLVQGEPEKVITSETVKQVYDIDLKLSTVDGKPYVIAV